MNKIEWDTGATQPTIQQSPYREPASADDPLPEHRHVLASPSCRSLLSSDGTRCACGWREPDQDQAQPTRQRPPYLFFTIAALLACFVASFGVHGAFFCPQSVAVVASVEPQWAPETVSKGDVVINSGNEGHVQLQRGGTPMWTFQPDGRIVYNKPDGGTETVWSPHGESAPLKLQADPRPAVFRSGPSPSESVPLKLEGGPALTKNGGAWSGSSTTNYKLTPP